MNVDFKTAIIRMHVLHYANQNAISVPGMKTKLERQGYVMSEQEVEQELDKLAQQKLLASLAGSYKMTYAGRAELDELKPKISVLHEEMNGLKPPVL
ncbi:hypothetical protein [Paenibacillus xerothermodurans]|uniref:Uncharacterized protein n=1 Tax=Paenibacillus xerothermodurans TaxID=1977292 RepID=A0A2W1NB30_PAEXE|nr:hypothetical protein [Paenibacillus xerothermodurans]PZE21627.1 hypothetical protein CBW46_004170 [Paenibacillus xerothermodurans]